MRRGRQEARTDPLKLEESRRVGLDRRSDDGLEAKISSRPDLDQLRRYGCAFSRRHRFHGLLLAKGPSGIDLEELRKAEFRELRWMELSDWLRDECRQLRGSRLSSRHLAGFLAGNFADAIDGLYQGRTKP